MKSLKSALYLFITLFFLAFIVHSTYTAIDGLTDENKTAEVAVILGNKVNEDGTLSPRLQKRLECGLSLYQKKRIKYIMVSGGLGKEGFYEGDKMKEFLIKNGVPDSLIIVDNQGNSTISTVENTIQLMESLKFKSLIVVSQYFHLTRTKMLFKNRGLTNISSVSPSYFEGRDIYSLVREFVAYYTER